VSRGSEPIRVLVAGAAGAVGFACAEAFSNHGAEVILTDCDGDALTRAADRLEAFSSFCDAIGTASLDIFAQELSALYPGIDVLVNAAGRGYVRALAMTKMTRAMLPLLRRGKGARWIFNIEAETAATQPETLFPYASSPPAFRALSRSFEEELRGSSINVVAISRDRDTFVATDLNEQDRSLAERRNAIEIAEDVLAAVSTGRPEWKSRHRPRTRRA
jgi:NAD(P)-dependent dehydrogenase (short-subunit alcohol dehydrogenase family)